MAFGRLFFNHSADVLRISLAHESGTLQPDPTFVTASGMTGLECSLQPLSANKVPTHLGIAFGESWRITFDVESLPSGAVVYEGDRVVIDGTTYTIREALLVGDVLSSQQYHCLAERRTD